MPKQPAILLYTGDWKKDPALSACSPATRGLWIDAVTAMHDLRTGTLSGTPDALSRNLRCSPADVLAAHAELKSTGAADVAERNGVLYWVCRRLERERKSREDTRLRVSKHRAKPAALPVKQECNGPPSWSVTSSKEGKPTNPTTRRAEAEPEPRLGPSLKEVKAWASTIACPEAEAERFWNHFEASGWIDKHGHPIVNPRAKLANWATDARSRPLEAAHKAHSCEYPARPVSAGAELVLRQKELERVEARIKWLREQGNGAFNELDAKTKAELTTMKKRRVELIGLLGLAV